MGDAGYHVLAPDQRGYGTTDMPAGIDEYTQLHLVGDIVGLLDACGIDRAVVVGHDWGGVAAWAVAHLHRDRVERLVVMNAPHPRALRDEMRASGEQRKRSRYIFRFQIPVLPERRLSRDHAAQIARALRGGSHVREVWTPDELEHYRNAFDEPRKLRGPLAYYRTGFRNALLRRRVGLGGPVEVPTLVIWGMHDHFLSPTFADEENLKRYAPDVTVVRIDEAGHFVQNEAPEHVNAALLGWLDATR